MKQYKMPILLLVLSFFFALLSIVDSGAISHARIAREVSLNITHDTNGILKLEGFDAKRVLDIQKDFVKTGSITNQFNKTIRLQILMKVDFATISNSNRWLGLQIGDAVREFGRNDHDYKEITLELTPGQSVDVWTALAHNQNENVILSFHFKIADRENTFTIKLEDTVKTPRRLICY